MAENDEDRYVVPNQERGGWDAKKEEAKRASSHHDTQAEAIDRAKEIVENTGEGKGDVRVQGQDGKFRDGISGSKNDSPAKDVIH